jgi:hypothetical protein
MADLYDDPAFQAYLRRAKEEMFPKLKASAANITIAPGEDPDPKICIELGASILYDKPIIVIVPDGRKVQANLKRVAAAIIEGHLSDPAVMRKIEDALKRVLANDERAREQQT